MKRHIWQAISILGSIAVGGIISYFIHSPIPWLVFSILAIILLIFYCFWGRVSSLISKVALRKCPSIHQLSVDLSEAQSKYKESQQALSQAKDDLAYIICKILPLKRDKKNFSIGEDLAQYALHLSLTLNNSFGFHIDIESIKPEIKIDGWELGGEYQTKSSWSNINSCQIEIDQSITPAVASELRQKEESEITIGCDLVLAIWIKDANIRSQVKYRFAV